MDRCVMCGADLATECGSMVCPHCLRSSSEPRIEINQEGIIFYPPKPNVELSFNGGKGDMDFSINYRRAKPLNRFQIWMFKVCFGICARNI
jgi:hypothetical protein